MKKGCEVGECGACTVIIDGETVDSCIYLAAWAEGKNIRTLEGLERTEILPVFRKLLLKRELFSADSVRRALLCRQQFFWKEEKFLPEKLSKSICLEICAAVQDIRIL